MKLLELARRLECRLDGDGDIEVCRVESLDRATASDLSFFANPRYAGALQRTKAAAVILGDDAPAAPCAMLRSPHPYLAFAEAVDVFADPVAPPRGVHALASVDETAVLGHGVAVEPFAIVGAGARLGAGTIVCAHAVIGPEAVLGERCLVHSHVAIRERVTIGDRVVIQNGAVIGSDGYGFARRPDGSHRKIQQAGTVVIEDDVEVGANAAIDRPSLGETRIQAGAKIDNLVQIGHGVTVGRNVLLAGQVGIAGSTTIEDDVVLAGQVGVAGHITIGKGVVATAQSGIPNSVDPGSFVSGYPAISNRDWLRSSAVFRQLPELRKLVSGLQRRIEALERAAVGTAPSRSADRGSPDRRHANARAANGRPAEGDDAAG